MKHALLRLNNFQFLPSDDVASTMIQQQVFQDQVLSYEVAHQLKLLESHVSEKNKAGKKTRQAVDVRDPLLSLWLGVTERKGPCHGFVMQGKYDMNRTVCPKTVGHGWLGQVQGVGDLRYTKIEYSKPTSQLHNLPNTRNRLNGVHLIFCDTKA